MTRLVEPRPKSEIRQLLGQVAIEMTIAGGQVLREEFGFTQEQTKRWIELTTERAKKNRERES